MIRAPYLSLMRWSALGSPKPWLRGMLVAGVVLTAGAALAQDVPPPAEALPAPAAAAAEPVAAPATPVEEGIPHYPLEHPDRMSWSFSGPFGTYDTEQLQRGLQVYTQVCAACHGLSRVAFRTLSDPTGPALTDEQMRALAATYQVVDPDTGETREGRPPDYFPASRPFGATTPPDLSLMAKARGVSDGFPSFITDAFIQYQEAGPNYIHALLTGYQQPPAGTTVPPGLFYNPFFAAASSIAMPPILQDGAVDYADDAIPQTADQYARDVAAFLMWTAEPKLDQRKKLGFEAMVFLIAFAALLYLSKRRVWAKVKH